MARDYSYRLEKYGISHSRERELVWACRQYEELKARIRAERRGEVEKRPGHSRYYARKDPTGNKAARLADSAAAVRLRAIEDSAKAVGGDAMWRYLIRNVCMGIGYTRLQPPCGVNQFSRMRVAFLLELDRRI